MDSKQFDALSRSLAAVNTRRGIMRLLGALPLVGVLLTVLDDESTDAKRHRQPQLLHGAKHERPHGAKRGNAQKNKKHKKKRNHKPASPPPEPGCTPESAAL